jgi:hypothetical protein
MTAIIGYAVAGILTIILVIFAMIKYKMFAVQEAVQAPELPQETITEPEPVIPLPMPETTNTEKLYDLSKSLLGTRLGRDKSIPWMVNCANACTDVLIRVGVKGLPPKGIAGTASLLSFLEDSPEFSEVLVYTPGAVIIAATGTGNGKARGHTGICGNHVIMSNNSESGFWDDQWNWTRWHDYYTVYAGIPTRFFVIK